MSDLLRACYIRAMPRRRSEVFVEESATWRRRFMDRDMTIRLCRTRIANDRNRE
jgi:hypothetical protein